MWIIDAPSSTARRASAAYSSGVYGIAGHCSRFATAPEMAHVRMTGSSRLIGLRQKLDVSLPTLAHRATARNCGPGFGYSGCRSLRKDCNPMIVAIILGIVAGFVGRLLMPGRDPMGFFATVLLGLAGALVGWLIFTGLLGIGDHDKFDLGGLVGAIMGVMILLAPCGVFLGGGGAPRSVWVFTPLVGG